MTESHLTDIIAEFYGDQYHGHPMRPGVDGNAPLLALMSRLHDRVFPDYLFDPAEVLAQDERFAGNPLVLFTGINDGGFSLWAEDPAINQRIQSALAEGDRETDTNS